MTCPRCAAPVGPDDIFCSICGAHLRRVDDSVIFGDDGDGRGGRGRGLGIVAVVVLNAGLLVASAFLVYAVFDRYRGKPRAAIVRLGAPRQVLSSTSPASRPVGVSSALRSPKTSARASQAPSPRRRSEGRRWAGSRRRGVKIGAKDNLPQPSNGRKYMKTQGKPAASQVPPSTKGEAKSSMKGHADAPKSSMKGHKEGNGALMSSRPPGEGTPKASKVTAKARGGSSKEVPSSRPVTAPVALSARERRRVEFNAQTVRRVIRHYLPRLRSCYARATKRGQVVGGVIEIRFLIGAGGAVRRSEVSSNTTGAQGLGRCIAAKMARWRFPKPVGGEVEFIYPFVFSSGS